MNKYDCNNHPNGMQETTPCRSKLDIGDKRLPFNSRRVRQSSGLSYAKDNQRNAARISVFRFRGCSSNLELPSQPVSFISLTSKNKFASTINKPDNRSVQSSNGIDKANPHASTSQYESSSNKSVSDKVNNTDSLPLPNLLSMPLSFADVVRQPKRSLNKKQADNSSAHYPNMDNNAESDLTIKKIESEPIMPRTQPVNNDDNVKVGVPPTTNKHSDYKDKKAVSFNEWLDEIKIINAETLEIPSDGLQEADLFCQLRQLEITCLHRMKLIENLIGWTELFEHWSTMSLITIFYALVKADIFLWPRHKMTPNEIKFMKILLSTLTSKYKVRDGVIQFRSISNALLASSNLSGRDVMHVHINKLVHELLILIKELNVEADFQGVSNALSAIVKLLLNKMISIKNQTVINAVTKLLSTVVESGKEFGWLSANTVMGSVGKLMQMEIKDKHCVMNAFNELLKGIVPLAQQYGTSIGLCSVLSGISWVMKEKTGDMKIPDHIDITKDIIEPLFCCVNKINKHRFNGYDLTMLFNLISYFRESGLIKIENIFKPVVMLTSIVPVVSKKTETWSVDVSLMASGIGKIINMDIIKTKEVANALPSMVNTLRRRMDDFSIEDCRRALYYVKEVTRSGIGWNIKYENLIYDILHKTYKFRADLVMCEVVFIISNLSHILSFGVVRKQNENLIEFISDTLIPYINENKEQVYIYKSQIPSLVWSLAVVGECADIQKDLLLYIINTDVVDSMHVVSEISKTLWGLTCFYVQLTTNDHLKCSLKKSMNILFEKLKIVLKNTSKYEKSLLRVYLRTLIQTALWLEIDIDVDTLIFHLDNVNFDSSQIHKKLLKKMKHYFKNEIILNEWGEKGFASIDILFPRRRLGFEVQGPSHYGNGILRLGSTIFKLLSYRKMGYTMIEVPVDDIEDNEKLNNLYQQIERHIVACQHQIAPKK